MGLAYFRGYIYSKSNARATRAYADASCTDAQRSAHGPKHIGYKCPPGDMRSRSNVGGYPVRSGALRRVSAESNSDDRQWASRAKLNNISLIAKWIRANTNRRRRVRRYA